MGSSQVVPEYILGVLADVQYGDIPNGGVEGRQQRYRESPAKCLQAVKTMLAAQDPPSLILTVGDMIEGKKEFEQSPQQDESDLRTITSIFAEHAKTCQVAHLLGNHDLCLGRPDRQYLLKCLGMPSSYYKLTLTPAWTLLVLDTTDLTTGTWSKPNWPEGSPQLAEAHAYFNAHPHDDGENQHMIGWNGGIGAEQMRWLQSELSQAEAQGQRVIVASHHPLGLGCARRGHMAWNFREISNILVGSKAVALAISGHDHCGGYARHGHVHFVTQQAILESPENSNAFSMLKLFDDRIEVEGHGTVPSRTLSI